MITEYELPFQPSLGNATFSTTLASKPYFIRQRWNSRDAAWFIDIREITLAPIALGLKIVLGAFIGRHVNHPLFRRGVLVAQDLAPVNGKSRDAGLDDLGQRVIVKYIPVLDVIRRQTEFGAFLQSIKRAA